MRKLTILISTIILSLAISSCTSIVPYYKQDIQQGNVLSQSEVSQLKAGMSKAEVINILGNPVIEKAFVPNELAYVSTNLSGKGQYTEKRLILSFRNDKLVSAKGDFKTSF